ncbi:3D domain-containing protein [Vagococcus zengguangii]|nr:3D domain-containing protein [Vagococcus zengguangii]
MTSVFAVNVNADNITDLKQQEAAVESKAEQIDSEINQTLAEVNKKYAVLADLNNQISKSEETIKETEKNIAKTKETIEKRKETAAKRFQTMQLNGDQLDSFGAILSAANVSDFLSRLYAISVIQGAENSKVTALISEQEKLEKLEETLATTQSDLKQQEAAVVNEKQALDEKVASLQVTYDENKELLTNLATKRAAAEAVKQAEEEAAAKAAAKAKLEAEAKEKAEQEAQASKDKEVTQPTEEVSKETTPSSESKEESSQNSSSSESSKEDNTTSTTDSNEQSESSKEPEVSQPEKPSVSQGQAGQATAYLATGNLTATGTVPTPGRTIAVDPSVIPLGSLVQITVPSMPQYNGVYRAEDTGGAVHGNIIDIFFSNETDARNFGRRAIYFTVM